MDNIFFDNWNGILRTLILTPMAYCAMIIFLRVSGKRTLSKMNAFEFIGTIALGSALATVALSKSVAFIEGAVAIMLLVLLQCIFTWATSRSSSIRALITNQPSLLLYHGEVLKTQIKKERIGLEELYSIARSQGFSSLKDIDVMVLETNGDITVIPTISDGKDEALKDVKVKK